MGVLNLELLGDFAAGFLAKNLLAANPAILIHEVEPASDDIESFRQSVWRLTQTGNDLRQVHVPVRNGQEMEAFIPQEAPGEEWS